MSYADDRGNERIFFNEGGIFVSQARVVMPVYRPQGCLGGFQPRAGEEQTFATGNLTSVSLSSYRNTGSLLIGILLLLIGTILSFIGMGVLIAEGVDGLVLLVPGIAPIAIVIIFRKWFFSRLYAVTLYTAGNNVRGFQSKDQAYIRRIVAAVNEAIIARG